MKRPIRLINLLFMTVLLVACAGASPETPVLNEGIIKLTPYHTLTATRTVTPTPEYAPTNTLAPTATATPRIYDVKGNDTLIGIAYRNGLTLAELQTANPDVNAYTLSIGMTLVLPAPSGLSGTEVAPTPTPVPVKISEPRCLPSLTGGYFCFAMVENDTSVDLQNLAAEFLITDPVSGVIFSQGALLPMQLFPAGARLPFYTYFAHPTIVNPHVSVQLLTAITARSDEKIALPLLIEGLEVTIASDGLTAMVIGTARFDKEGFKGKPIRLVAVAYDTSGNAVGLRRYEEDSELKSGDEFRFSITVYSSASEIQTVEVYGEVQP